MLFLSLGLNRTLPWSNEISETKNLKFITWFVGEFRIWLFSNQDLDSTNLQEPPSDLEEEHGDHKGFKYAEGIKKKPDPHKPKKVEEKVELDILQPPSSSNMHHTGTPEEIRRQLDARPLRDSRSPENGRSRSRSPRGRGFGGSADVEVPVSFQCVLTGDPVTDPVRGVSGEYVFNRPSLTEHVLQKRKEPASNRKMGVGQITSDKETLRDFQSWCERNLHASGIQRLLDELNRSAAQYSDSEGEVEPAPVGLDRRREDHSRFDDRYQGGGRGGNDRRFEDDRRDYPGDDRRQPPPYNDRPPDPHGYRVDGGREAEYHYQDQRGRSRESDYVPSRYDTRNDYDRRDYDPRGSEQYPPRGGAQDYGQRADAYPNSYPSRGVDREPLPSRTNDERSRDAMRAMLTGQRPPNHQGPPGNGYPPDRDGHGRQGGYGQY